jgi:hypothetical protein
MTAETFAANLRAEMGRQRRDVGLFLQLLGEVYGWPHPWVPLAGNYLPTPAEINALATALGCPVERLTVSREELEVKLESAFLEIAERRGREVRLRERVAELETATDPVDVRPSGRNRLRFTLTPKERP